MTKYGRSAIDAVRFIRKGTVQSPQKAWNKATTAIFGEGTSSQLKGCPKGAFLGLCQEGLIEGIPPGKYTQSEKNKRYAVLSVEAIKSNPDLASDKHALWTLILVQEIKAHNQQLDVVTALWRAGLIKT
jgi:hypothetical protein